MLMRGRVTKLTVGMGREVLDEDVGASVVVELTVLEVEDNDDDLERNGGDQVSVAIIQDSPQWQCVNGSREENLRGRPGSGGGVCCLCDGDRF